MTTQTSSNGPQGFLWPAPAKLNLFLHITGRRDDGYHLLQTAFQFVDYGDQLQFEITDDACITRISELDGVASDDDLVVKAAKLLQKYTHSPLGCHIQLDKRLPMGGGLGGGSSNAATTLVALNKLWQTQLTQQELAQLGLQLGADVPIFIFGQSAWAEGIGEKLTPITVPEPWYLIIAPPVHVETGKIFSASQLTRDQHPIRIRDLWDGERVTNVCEPVVTALYPEVGEALKWLSQFRKARMTGTGACIFAAFDTQSAADEVASQAPAKWRLIVTRGRNKSPLSEL